MRNLSHEVRILLATMLIGAICSAGVPRAQASAPFEPDEDPTTTKSAELVTQLGGVPIELVHENIRAEAVELQKVNEEVSTVVWGSSAHASVNYVLAGDPVAPGLLNLTAATGAVATLNILFMGPLLTGSDEGIPLPAGGISREVIAVLSGPTGEKGVHETIVSYNHDSGPRVTDVLIEDVADVQLVQTLQQNPLLGQAASHLAQTQTAGQLAAVAAAGSFPAGVLPLLAPGLAAGLVAHHNQQHGPVAGCALAASTAFAVAIAQCALRLAACTKAVKLAFLTAKILCKKAAPFMMMFVFPIGAAAALACWAAAWAGLKLAKKACDRNFRACMERARNEAGAALIICYVYM